MASEGSLVIYTFLSNETIPAENAVVTITQTSGDNTTLLGIRLTDENGKTAPITIKTPDIEYSLEPQSDVIPFTLVDVRVDYPSTYTAITRNVQIFPDETSLENVRLIPLGEDVTFDNKTEYVDITPQNL